MITYLDTSAIIPVLIAEPSTATCRRLWGEADRRVTSRLTYVEVAAALRMATVMGRLKSRQCTTAWAAFEEIWPDLDVVEVSAELAARAAALAHSETLRGYDAVHCASAVALGEPQLVAASGDSRLVAAWTALGLAVIDTNATV